jgi:hypothetical protein
MESSGPKRRFPAPWRVERTQHGFEVLDANGIRLAHVYARDELHRAGFGQYLEHLTTDEARRIAAGIARLPDFMMQRVGFNPRGGGDFRWKKSRPYHVALEDSYIRAHWGWIDAVCRLNSLPFDPTGQRIDRDGSWCVYEFAMQLDAIQFWDRFNGRWLRGEEFIYPDRPKGLPTLREPPDMYRHGRRPY